MGDSIILHNNMLLLITHNGVTLNVHLTYVHSIV